MPPIKDYIKSKITIDLKDFTYIRLDRLGYVESYETPILLKNLVDDDLYNVRLADFLSVHKSVLGMNIPSLTFIKWGEDDFIQHSDIKNDEMTCSCVIKDLHTPDIKFNPTGFLFDNIKRGNNIFFLNITNIPQFAHNRLEINMLEIMNLDEFFYEEGLTRIYKRVDEFYIFE